MSLSVLKITVWWCLCRAVLHIKHGALLVMVQMESYNSKTWPGYRYVLHSETPSNQWACQYSRYQNKIWSDGVDCNCLAPTSFQT
jgi:hypothetical protein